MALHRDIFWVGRQWAVTGIGLQAIDQRLKGAFDIEKSRLWDEELRQDMHAYPWLNVEDFEKALAVARARFPEPSRATLPLVESVLELIRPMTAEAAERTASPQDPILPPGAPAPREPAQQPRTQPPVLNLKTKGALARFMPQWRIKR